MADDSSQNLMQVESRTGFSIDVHTTLQAWLSKTVKSGTVRSRDIQNDKGKAVSDFFEWFGDVPERVQPQDVIAWLEFLKAQEKAQVFKSGVHADDPKLKEGTIYNRMSALSNYFDYLRIDLGLERIIPINPVKATMPKTPGSYTSKSVQPLSIADLKKLISVVKNHAVSGGVMYLRDHAILRLFVATGRRRQEILSLTGDCIKIENESIIIRTKVKGGYFSTFEVKDQKAREALRKYLEASGRSEAVFGEKVPLWLRHYKGRTGKTDRAMSSHGFAKRMSIYADEAKIENFHIHKLRHTFASIVANEAGSLAEASEALGHSDMRVTQRYVKRLAVLKDRFSDTISRVIDDEDDD